MQSPVDSGEPSDEPSDESSDSSSDSSSADTEFEDVFESETGDDPESVEASKSEIGDPTTGFGNDPDTDSEDPEAGDCDYPEGACAASPDDASPDDASACAASPEDASPDDASPDDAFQIDPADGSSATARGPLATTPESLIGGSCDDGRRECGAPPGSAFSLRPVQAQMLAAIRRRGGRGRLRFETPPGSGKTTFLAWLAASQLDPDFRCVFFVPTKSIAHDVAAIFSRFGVPCALLHSGSRPALASARAVVCCFGSSLRLAGLLFEHVYVDEAHHLENVESRAAPALRPYLHAISAMPSALRIEISATFRSRAIDLCVSHDTAVAEQIVLPLRYIVPQYRGADRMSAVANYLLANTHIHRRVLAYCNSRLEAERFASVALLAGLLVQCVFGDTPMARRAELLEQFTDGRARVLVSVGTLCEGVDIRAADTCVFVEARSSLINVWQCIGRVMRVHGDKQWGWVVLPTTAESSELRLFADVIRLHDPSAFTRRKPGSRFESVSADWVYDEVFTAVHEYDSLDLALCGNWWLKLAVLRDYITANGCLPVQRTVWTRPDGSSWNIGIWSRNQRVAHKKGALAQDRAEELGAIPGWKWADDPWPENAEVLREYIRANGRLPVKRTVWTRPDGSSWNIGSWIHNQRTAYKKGALAQDRAEELGAIPEWKWANDPWPENAELLREYIRANGRLPVKKTVWTRPDGSSWNIGIWQSDQRRAYKKGALAQDRAEELGAIPEWKWADRA